MSAALGAAVCAAERATRAASCARADKRASRLMRQTVYAMVAPPVPDMAAARAAATSAREHAHDAAIAAKRASTACADATQAAADAQEVLGEAMMLADEARESCHVDCRLLRTRYHQAARHAAAAFCASMDATDDYNEALASAAQSANAANEAKTAVTAAASYFATLHCADDEQHNAE